MGDGPADGAGRPGAHGRAGRLLDGGTGGLPGAGDRGGRLPPRPARRHTGRAGPHPAQTGLLSYGFNYLGYFPQPGYAPWPISLADFEHPERTVAIAEVGTRLGPALRPGSANWNVTSGAAWLDNYWQADSFPAVRAPGPPSPANVNFRFQSQGAKHAGGVTVLFGDGHVGSVRPSALTWGAFYGVFAPDLGPYGAPHAGPFRLPGTAPSAPPVWCQPVASPALDRAEARP